MEKMFERYELLCKDVKHQIDFVDECYAMDFEHLQQTLDEMKELQKTIKQNQKTSAIIKTAKMTFTSIKQSDGWMELVNDLKFEQFKNEHPEMDEDELSDKFYTEVVSKRFKHGEFGSFEIIVDENFNIVGGRIF